MSRYCILATPRTGSTWLNTGIGYTCARFKNFINLSEFFSPFIDTYSRYELDANQMIRVTKDTVESGISSVEEFLSARLALLLSGDPSQSLILKYMYWPHQGIVTSALDNLIKIKEHNITIVNIHRDPFDSSISMLTAAQTGFYHRWRTQTNEAYSTNHGVQASIDVPSLRLSESDFEILYMQMLMSVKEKLRIADCLKCPTINYSSLRMDCITHRLPFQILTHSKKLYDVDYSEIIQNYDQLLEIKQKVDNMEI